MKLFIAPAVSPYGNEFGCAITFATNREEAIQKFLDHLNDEASTGRLDVRGAEYRDNIVRHLNEHAREIESGVFVDWSPA